MPKRTRDYREGLLEDLQEPSEAAAYLTASLEDSQEMFLLALRDLADASQMSKVAASAGVARESIYRMLSTHGNPRFTSLLGVLNALGLRMCFVPTDSSPLAMGGPNDLAIERSSGGLTQQRLQARAAVRKLHRMRPKRSA